MKNQTDFTDLYAVISSFFKSIIVGFLNSEKLVYNYNSDMYKFPLLIIIATIGLLVFGCSPEAEITEENVSRIISTLSADEMKGRHAFSDEIHDAADFVTSEFELIGLTTLPGETGYRQNFSIFSIKPSESSISINGKELNDKYYFGLIYEEEISWNSEIPTKYISEDDSYREKFTEYTNDDEASLILVSKNHEKWFHRFRGYITRSVRTFELQSNPNDVFILYDDDVRDLEVNIKNDIKEIKLFNVAGMIEGERKDEIVIVSAHYDHVGVVSPVNKDSVVNGANDNASGVAGMIELARYFESRKKPARTIYFVGFTAEEMGGYGSRYFTQHIDPEEIIAMVNIEMIGKPAVEEPNTAWITGFERSDFGEIFKESVTDNSFVFYPDPYPNQNLFFRSDNAALARLGVPAHTISTTPIDVDQDYHRVTDEFNTLDITHTTNTIKAISKATKLLVSGTKTPTRITIEELDD